MRDVDEPLSFAALDGSQMSCGRVLDKELMPCRPMDPWSYGAEPVEVGSKSTPKTDELPRERAGRAP